MSFSDDISAFRAKVNTTTEQVFRSIALDLFGNVINRTPVDTGRARGNWTAKLNAPSKDVLVTGHRNSLSSAEKVVSRVQIGDTIFFVNNLPYIGKLEHGSSSQAPAGMVKVTVTEFEKVAKDAVKRSS